MACTVYMHAVLIKCLAEIPNIPVCTFQQKGECVLPQNGKHCFQDPVMLIIMYFYIINV